MLNYIAIDADTGEVVSQVPDGTYVSVAIELEKSKLQAKIDQIKMQRAIQKSMYEAYIKEFKDVFGI